MGTRITAIEYHLPEDTLTNHQLAQQFSTTADAIFKLSGVTKRHIAQAGATPSDLACLAAEKLFSKHPDDRQRIDTLLFCTEGLDYKAPVTACIIQHRLQLSTHCLALDIPGGCTGFINGLLIAKSLIESGHSRSVLLLTAETVSKILHNDDLYLRALFGDGAAATLITPSTANHIGHFVTGTDGSGEKALWVERSGVRNPPDLDWMTTHQANNQGLRCGRLHMQGDAIMHFALTRVPQLIRDTLAINQDFLATTAQHSPEDSIDFYLFHQASHVILKALQRKCRLPKERFVHDLADHGNTVSSSIPIALCHLMQTQHKNDFKVLLAGFGVGFSWGATIVQISAKHA